MNSICRATIAAFGGVIIAGCILLAFSPVGPVARSLEGTTCRYADGEKRLRAAMTAMGGSQAADMAVAASFAKSQAISNIKCFPSWGVSWTAMAMLTLASEGPSEDFQEYFGRSELTAPSDVPSIKERVRMLLALRDDYPKLWIIQTDMYLKHALHVDISDFLLTLSDSERVLMVDRMRQINTPQVRRWFKAHEE